MLVLLTTASTVLILTNMKCLTKDVSLYSVIPNTTSRIEIEKTDYNWNNTAQDSLVVKDYPTPDP